MKLMKHDDPRIELVLARAAKIRTALLAVSASRVSVDPVPGGFRIVGPFSEVFPLVLAHYPEDVLATFASDDWHVSGGKGSFSATRITDQTCQVCGERVAVTYSVGSTQIQFRVCTPSYHCGGPNRPLCRLTQNVARLGAEWVMPDPEYVNAFARELVIRRPYFTVRIKLSLETPGVEEPATVYWSRRGTKNVSEPCTEFLVGYVDDISSHSVHSLAALFPGDNLWANGVDSERHDGDYARGGYTSDLSTHYSPRSVTDLYVHLKERRER